MARVELRSIISYMRACIWAVLLMGVLGQINFAVLSASASPNTAKSTASVYSILLNTTSPFNISFGLNLVFPSTFALTTVTLCTFTVNSATIPSTCSLSSNIITFSGMSIAQTVTSVGLSFTTATARYTSVQVITLQYFSPANPSTLYGTNSAAITVTDAMMPCSVTSSSNIVGDTVSYTLSYSPTVTIEAGSVVQIQMTAWSSYSLSNFISSSNTSGICGGQCTVSPPNPSQGFYLQTIKYSSLYPSSSSSVGTITMNTARNPASTQAISVTITVLAFISSSSQYSYMRCTTPFAVSQPNTFKGVTFSVSNTSISASNTIKMLLSLTNPISSACYLSILPATDLSLSYRFVTSNQATPILSPSTGSALLLSNLTVSITQFNSFFLGDFTLITPPYANTPLSITFQSEIAVSNTFYPIDRITITVTAVTSNIVSASLSSSQTAINTPSTLMVLFTTVNGLIGNSQIVLTLPPGTSTAGVTASLSAPASCSISSLTTVTCILSVAAAPSGMTLSLSNFMNPRTTTPTASFQLGTYYYNATTPVDVLATSLSLTATPVPLKGLSISSSSLSVGAISTYTISISVTNTLPASSSFTVLFPPSTFSSLVPALLSFTLNGNSVPGCSMTAASPLLYSFSDCVTGDATGGVPMVVVLGNIGNPLSTKTTGAITVQIYFNSFLMEYMSGTVTMTTPVPLQLFSVAAANPTTGALTTYSFNLAFTYNNSARLQITIPPEVTLSSGFICGGSVLVTCLQTSARLLTVTFPPGQTSLLLNVSNMLNNYYASTSLFTVITSTADTVYNYVESSSCNLTFQPASLSVSIPSDNGIVLLGLSTVRLIIVSPLSAGTNGYLQVIVPADLSVASCSVSPYSCLVSSTQVVLVQGITDISSTIVLTLHGSTSYFSTSSPFQVRMYYSSFIIATNTTAVMNAFCLAPCQQCSTQTGCVSCLNSTYTPNNTLYASTCVSACPATYFTNGAICSLCNTTFCLQCVTDPNTCTSCHTGTYLFQSGCIPACPNLYYAATNNNQCMQCSSPCINCTAPQACIACLSGFYLNADATCTTTCKNYLQIGVSGLCLSCTANCLTCSISTSNCTSCPNSFVFTLNTCVRACPQGQFNNSQSACQLCIPPCNYCNSATICVNCVSSYYLYNSNTCLSVCPAGLVGVVDTCVACAGNCATCQNTTTSCLSCTTGTYLSGNQCGTTCPDPTYPSNGLCSKCVSPCANCLTASLCKSCAPSFYLYNSNTCLSACPAGLVGVVDTCVACAGDCATCQNTTTSCLSCTTGTYLSGNQCGTTCPALTYPSNGLCSKCVSPCSSCLSTVICSTCLPSYFLYNSQTCLSVCPAGLVGVVDTCVLCKGSCAACQNTTTSCLSCTTGTYLSGNQCGNSCPSLTYPSSNGVCQKCVSPCSSCTSVVICSSCLPSFFLYNSQTCLSVCPAGFVGVVDTCVKCSANCSTCQGTSSTCLSCSAGTFYYASQCVSTCPTPNFPYNGMCTLCVSPCATCLSSAFACSTCIATYKILGTSCVQACPSSGYLSTNTTCVACEANCLSCQSASTCLTCSSSYFLYLGSCVLSCPANAPIVVSRVCTSCSGQCNTCSDSPDNCLSCTVGYFKFSYTCVGSCPISYYSDLTSYTCESGLNNKIVFFPVLITQVVVVGVGMVVKCLSPITSLPTVLVSLCSLLQIAIWSYLLAVLTGGGNEVGIEYTLPIVLISVAFLALAVGNILFYFFNRPDTDEYVKKWCLNNVNYTTLQVCRYISLISHKLFRLIYSKVFHSLHFSVAPSAPQAILRMSTLFTLYGLLFCELPVIVASFYLAYEKVLKDQLFYTAVEALAVTIVSLVLSLIDIHKSADYFEDTEFMLTKRYIDRVKDSSCNKILEGEYFEQDAGSLDAERHVGHTGGLFSFSKQDPNTLNQLLFEDKSQGKSELTHALDVPKESGEELKSQESRRSITQRKHNRTMINVFQPIVEEEAEYYEQEMYPEEEVQTAAALQKQMRREDSDEQLRQEVRGAHRAQFGAVEDEDNVSMLEYRERKQKWNSLLSRRQEIAKKMFRVAEVSEEPQDPQEGPAQRKPRRRKRRGKVNKELEKIYLDRMTAKKNVFASSRSFNYDF